MPLINSQTGVGRGGFQVFISMGHFNVRVEVFVPLLAIFERE
jgi:hypothetical protein